MLNAARAIQGIAAATVNVASLALVSAAFPGAKQKARAIGIWTAIAGAALAVGPMAGGVLVQHGGWRSIFLVNVPVGLAVLALTWRYVAESRDLRPRRFDVPGQLLFVAAVGSFAYAVIEGPHVGWTAPRIPILFAVAAIACAWFVRCERRSADPMMDVTLFGGRTYALAIATIWVVVFSMYGMLLVMTQYLQNVKGYTPMATGLVLLPYSLATIAGSLATGPLVARAGSRWPLLAGLVMMIAGFAAMMAGMSGSALVTTIGLMGAGMGSALCLTPATALAMSAVPPARAGMASGIMSAQRAIGSTVGFAVLGSILAAWLGATLERDLAVAIPDPGERRAVAARIVAEANPRAYVAAIGTGRPIDHADAATRAAILLAADDDFVQGIRVALGTAIAALLGILAIGFAWFPREQPAGARLESQSTEPA